MQEKAKEPEIRFAGFTGAWEQRKLGDVLEFLKDGTHGTHPDADQGPLLLSAKNIKNGDVTWDDTDRKISQAEFDMIHSNFKLKKGDVLLTIVGSIGESAILKDPHEITFQRSVAFLRPNKTITSGFLYSEIQGEKFQTELNNRKSTSAQPGIYLGDLSEIPLDTPPNLKEQEEIGKFFSEINSLLTLHQRKYEKLLNIKKSMLEKMFPKEGEVVPKIRFKGFTGAWEQRVLGDFLEVSMETNSSAKFDKNDVLSISGDYGVVNQIAFQGRSFASNSVVKYGVLHNEDIVYTKSPLKANPYGIIKTNKGKAGIVSPLYAIYHPKNNLVPSFVQSYFEQNERLNNYLRPLVNKGAKNNMLISNEKAISGKVIFPSRKEQEKISALLERVDSLLTLHQRKLEMLKNVKQAFLEKMFV